MTRFGPATDLNSRIRSSTRCAKLRNGTGTPSPCDMYSFTFTGERRLRRMFLVPSESV